MPRLDQEIAKPEHVERMKFIRSEIERAVLPYRENTEAAIVAGAAVQVARTLIELYPPNRRAQLVEAMVAFLKREDLDAPEPGSGIVGPKGLM